MWTQKKIKNVCFASFFLFLLVYFGVFTHFFELEFPKDFHYPYDGNIEEFVQQMRKNITPSVKPINLYNMRFKKDCSDKCKNVASLRLVYLIKSAPQNFDRRIAIRSSWGFEKRFSDVEIRTVFLLGERDNVKLQKNIDTEAKKYSDIVQGIFFDDYYNNTLKTMLAFTWAVRFCPDSKFYMFVDDDYYVSTKNVLRFIRNPTYYPHYLTKLKEKGIAHADFELEGDVRLYAGYAFKSAPLRHWSSKWYVSLEEYPYDLWPPYVTAGAYILSRESLLDMYYASFYTKHFRFDDIYVALLAFKCNIEPFHSEEFYFNKLSYSPKGYEFVVASHGWGDSQEMLKAWTQQRSLGHV